MVQPKPSSPLQGLPATAIAGEDKNLQMLLTLLGNNRAYTILGHKGNGWLLHFEGDYQDSLVQWNAKGLPVVTKV